MDAPSDAREPPILAVPGHAEVGVPEQVVVQCTFRRIAVGFLLQGYHALHDAQARVSRTIGLVVIVGVFDVHDEGVVSPEKVVLVTVPVRGIHLAIGGSGFL